MSDDLALVVFWAERSKKPVTAREIKRSIHAFRHTDCDTIRDYFHQLAELGYGECQGEGNRLTFAAASDLDVSSLSEIAALPPKQKQRRRSNRSGLSTNVDVTLTKREYFAAIALQALLSNPNFDPDISLSEPYARAAHMALLTADCLIKEFEEYPEGC